MQSNNHFHTAILFWWFELTDWISSSITSLWYCNIFFFRLLNTSMNNMYSYFGWPLPNKRLLGYIDLKEVQFGHTFDVLVVHKYTPIHAHTHKKSHRVCAVLYNIHSVFWTKCLICHQLPSVRLVQRVTITIYAILLYAMTSTDKLILRDFKSDIFTFERQAFSFLWKPVCVGADWD